MHININIYINLSNVFGSCVLSALIPPWCFFWSVAKQTKLVLVEKNPNMQPWNILNKVEESLHSRSLTWSTVWFFFLFFVNKTEACTFFFLAYFFYVLLLWKWWCCFISLMIVCIFIESTQIFLTSHLYFLFNSGYSGLFYGLLILFLFAEICVYVSSTKMHLTSWIRTLKKIC